LLERIILQCFEIAMKGGLITAAERTGKGRTGSRKPARYGFEIRQRLFARHSELVLDLEEELAPEKRGEVSCQNAKRVIALAALGLTAGTTSPAATVVTPNTTRTTGRRIPRSGRARCRRLPRFP
jgi:hypothetical protein